MTTILSPVCPVCSQPPVFALSPVQAFCGNDDCPAFCWDMTRTRTENLDGVTYHDLSGLHTDQPGEG